MSLKKSSNFLRFFSAAEMNGSEKPSYRFKSFLLNAEERQLLRDGEPVALTPKVFDTLVYLVEHAGHLVEKSELMESVWRDSFVEEGNLTRSIHALRRALGQDANGNKFIETVPTKGYRFVAEVTPEVEAAPPARENGNALTTEVWTDQLEIRNPRSSIADTRCTWAAWGDSTNPSPISKRLSTLTRIRHSTSKSSASFSTTRADTTKRSSIWKASERCFRITCGRPRG